MARSTVQALIFAFLVTPELSFRDGNWVFVNFFYRDEANPRQIDDLATMLKARHESRVKRNMTR